MTVKQAALSEITKATPPLAATGLTLNEWVAIATFIYIGIQAAYLIWKWYKEANKDK